MQSPELLEEEKVLVSESVELTGTSVGALLESIRAVFNKGHRVMRLTYVRGSDLVVETLMPRAAAVGKGLLTPYQMARQHGRIVVQDLEEGEDRVFFLFRALRTCSDAEMKPRMILCRREDALNRWMFPNKEYPVHLMFGLPVVEDGDIPPGSFAVCASSTGDMIADVEYCVLCKVR